MPNPEQGPQQQGIVGTWQTVNLGLPDFLEPIRAGIDAFFSILIQILNILLQILEILKTFAIGFLDPVIALIEALLALIENLLADLRQAGLYIHGDFYLLEGPEFRDLLGGFTAFERRMITRLVDRSDPNRPNISSLSAVVAVFLYVSVDATALERIMRLLRGILALFNRRVPLPRSLGAVTGLTANYGFEGASVFSFTKPGFFPTREQLRNQKLSDVFNAVNITWQMAPTPGNFLTLFPQFPPAGFLVEVSTISQGITVHYDKPLKGGNEGAEENKGREAGTATNENGENIVLFGGVDQLRVDSSLEFNAGTSFTGDLLPLAARIFGVKNLSDAAPIEFKQLKDGNDYFIQKTFFVRTAQAAFFPGKGYGITIPFEEMPFDAEFEFKGSKTQIKKLDRPPQFFVRVRAVSKDIEGADEFAYDASLSIFDKSPLVLQLIDSASIELNDIGPLSGPLEVVFPGAFTEDYLRCVVSALAVMALSRADLPVKVGTESDDGNAPSVVTLSYPPADEDLQFVGTSTAWGAYVGTARQFTQLEDVAAILLPQLIGRKLLIKRFYRETVNVAKWRKRLLSRCVNLTNRMYLGNRPPSALEQTVVAACEDLLNFRWSDVDNGFADETIIESLRNGNVKVGLAPNPDSIGITSRERNAAAKDNVAILGRSPHFFQVSPAGNVANGVKGSVDSSPVYYDRENNISVNSMAFARNAFNDTIYAQAAFALRVAIGPFQKPQEKGWIAIRLFPQGIPDIDRFLDELLALLRSIRAALQAIVDLIRRFIEFLQSRIIELQATLNRINAMIQNLLRLFIGIPSAAGLVVVANGTDGVLQALVGAQNKPFDSPAAYGGGLVLLAGGIPTVALDIFKALIQGDG